MLQDILSGAQEVTVEGKNYSFEFDHYAYAALEKQTGKSIYEFYDELISKNNITYTHSCAFVRTGLIKHHSTDEICGFSDLLVQKPGIWHSIKEAVTTAFIVPLLPPEILLHTKKK